MPDAQQQAAEINARYGPDPRFQMLDGMLASPLGGIAAGAANLAGLSPEAQRAALSLGTSLDGLGMAAVGLAGRAPAYTGAQRPGIFETQSPYASPSTDYLVGRTRTDRMEMGIRFETAQGVLDNYSIYGGRSVTQLYVRAFDDNGVLLAGSVRLDRVGLRANGAYDLIDYKLSNNSPVTGNQGLHYPALAKNGGIVTGLRGD